MKAFYQQAFYQVIKCNIFPVKSAYVLNHSITTFFPKDKIGKRFERLINFNFLGILVTETNCQYLFHKSEKVTKYE